MIWKLKSRQLTFERPLLMGILNLTPDSFSDGGIFLEPARAVERVREMLDAGVDLLDLGAESTRPGAAPVSAEEEAKRLLPVLKSVRQLSDIPVSVDTTKPEIARRALELGADIINDVSGLRESGQEMAKVVRDFEAGLVLMHRRGTAATMQSLATYADVVTEVISELRESMELAFRAGIAKENLAVDPGFGLFAKTTEHNLALIRGLERFHEWGRPLVVGPSRKSFIGQVTGRGVHEREFGTAAVVTVCVLKGANVIRVHEPGGAKDVIRMTKAIQGETYVRAF